MENLEKKIIENRNVRFSQYLSDNKVIMDIYDKGVNVYEKSLDFVDFKTLVKEFQGEEIALIGAFSKDGELLDNMLIQSGEETKLSDSNYKIAFDQINNL